MNAQGEMTASGFSVHTEAGVKAYFKVTVGKKGVMEVSIYFLSVK